VTKLVEVAMKHIFLAAVVMLSLAACNMPTGTEATVGESRDTPIPNVAFTVDTTYISDNPVAMVARGRANNTGTATISTGWYIEAQFYTDASKRTTLGGNNTRIGVPLSPGQETLWTIKFASSNVDVRQYPNFTVGDLRAIYK
jgi:hypothetical protein